MISQGCLLIFLLKAEAQLKTGRDDKKADKTYIVACGSAGYVGIAASYMMSIIAKYQAIPVIASEFAYHVPFLTNKSVIIALFSVRRNHGYARCHKKARKKGAFITALVNSLGSTLYREADQKILVERDPKKLSPPQRP